MPSNRADDDRNVTLAWVGGGVVVLMFATAIVLACIFGSNDESAPQSIRTLHLAPSPSMVSASNDTTHHLRSDLVDIEELPTTSEFELDANRPPVTAVHVSEGNEIADDAVFMMESSHCWDRAPAHKAYSVVLFESDFISGVSKDVPAGFRPPAHVRMPSGVSLQAATAKRTGKPPMPGKRGNDEVTFLGSTAKGQRFCIVADCSGSMKGMPLFLVKQEMLKTLASLKEESQFFVMFFNTQAFPMPSRAWTQGGKKNVEAVVPWVTAVQAHGGTNPLPALHVALQLDPRPDVIFLMTDGIFHGAIPHHVKDMNRQTNVRINTILFSWAGPQPQAAAQLRKMADDAGGTFSNVQALRR